MIKTRICSFIQRNISLASVPITHRKILSLVRVDNGSWVMGSSVRWVTWVMSHFEWLIAISGVNRRCHVLIRDECWFRFLSTGGDFQWRHPGGKGLASRCGSGTEIPVNSGRRRQNNAADWKPRGITIDDSSFVLPVSLRAIYLILMLLKVS